MTAVMYKMIDEQLVGIDQASGDAAAGAQSNGIQYCSLTPPATAIISNIAIVMTQSEYSVNRAPSSSSSSA